MKNEDFLLKMKERTINESGSINHSIYKIIIEKPEEVSKLTLSEFAKKCFTSKPSIIKFCHKIGLSGFSELKYQIKSNILANKVLNQELTINREFQENDKFNKKYIELGQQYYSLLLENFGEQKIVVQNLVHLIKKSKIIYIFCANLAYYASKNFLQKLRWINKHVILENDFNIIESYVTQITAEALVIIVSLSGLNPHILQITNSLNHQHQLFALTGQADKILHYTDKYFLIPQIERNLWDNYSLRAQYVTGFFDLIFIELL